MYIYLFYEIGELTYTQEKHVAILVVKYILKFQWY